MGRLYESLNSQLQKESYYEETWIEAADVNTFVCHLPKPDSQGGAIYPGLDYIPVFDLKHLHADNIIKFTMVNDKEWLAKIQKVVKCDHIMKGCGILELTGKVPNLPKMASPVRKVFGDDETLLSERLTEKYHKDIKNGTNLDDWLDPEEKRVWMDTRGG